MSNLGHNQTKYKNITISGLPGAGSSTLGKALKKTLNWKYFSSGDFMRNYAIKNKLIDSKNLAHHSATVYTDDFDRQVDFGMRETLQTKQNQILDSWLSGFVAQGVKGVLKILVFCNDKSILVDRVANRDNLKVSQAKKHIFQREKENVKKWKTMYAPQWQDWVVKRKIMDPKTPIWFWYPKLYDISIDTYKNSKQETLKLALEKLNFRIKDLNYQKLFSS